MILALAAVPASPDAPVLKVNAVAILGGVSVANAPDKEAARVEPEAIRDKWEVAR